MTRSLAKIDGNQTALQRLNAQSRGFEPCGVCIAFSNLIAESSSGRIVAIMSPEPWFKPGSSQAGKPGFSPLRM